MEKKNEKKIMAFLFLWILQLQRCASEKSIIIMQKVFGLAMYIWLLSCLAFHATDNCMFFFFHSFNSKLLETYEIGNNRLDGLICAHLPTTRVGRRCSVEVQNAVNALCVWDRVQETMKEWRGGLG